MDEDGARLFRGYKSEILKAVKSFANHNKQRSTRIDGAVSRLIPEDDDIQGALYLAKQQTYSERDRERNRGNPL